MKTLINRRYPFQLLPLNYAEDSFPEYFLTPQVFFFHRNKHHQGYIDKLNALLESDKYSHLKTMQIETLIKYALENKETALFNNAGQIWNHDFFWLCITPEQKVVHESALKKKIEECYGSLENFIDEFVNASLGNFGSGWSWLVYEDKKLSIINTSNAHNPIGTLAFAYPILGCDLWEHAYYLTFQNERGKYVRTMLTSFLDWSALEANYQSALSASANN